MPTKETLDRLWEMVEPLAAGQGLEVVDIEIRHEGSSGRVLRVYLDRVGEPDEAPGVDDLGRVSRELGDLLDVYDVVAGSYTLEVSSPGVNRPLRKPEHFARFVGRRVRVHAGELIGGRRNFRGPLHHAGGEGVTVLQDGREVFIPFGLIVKANVEYEWASQDAGPGLVRGKRCSRI